MKAYRELWVHQRWSYLDRFGLLWECGGVLYVSNRLRVEHEVVRLYKVSSWCWSEKRQDIIESTCLTKFDRTIGGRRKLLTALHNLMLELCKCFYNSLPPVSKAYGTLCLLTTTAYHLGLVSPYSIALIYEVVISRFQVWRLITNFFFLGKFSINFGIRLLMIARYGVQLEKGPFERRTADFLWMMMFGAFSLLALSAIPLLSSPFLGVSLVFMLLYVWSREFPNAQINIYGLVQLKAFYLPWAMLALDVIFGSPLIPDLLGIIAGHLYYFLTVLHPLAGGRNILKTPRWVHKLVARLGVGAQANSPVQPNSRSGVAFSGRSYRLS